METISVPVWRVVDLVALNRTVPAGQEMQGLVANHKSDEPVSRITSNDWGLGES